MLTLKDYAQYLPYGIEVYYKKSERRWVLDKDNFSFTCDIVQVF